jgi:hypothetical protein
LTWYEAAKMIHAAGGTMEVAKPKGDPHINFVLEYIAYMAIRIPSLTEFCAICDHRALVAQKL